jgi:hypothetical protein
VKGEKGGKKNLRYCLILYIECSYMRYPRSLMLPFSILMLLLIVTPTINSAHSTSQQRPKILSYGTVRVLFEIELKDTDDKHYLYNEIAIDVLGIVQRTPRYGVTGEALVHGMWVNSHFFDTTLSDRFVIRCTEEEAISMSIYSWVEWIAPTLEGTTCDGASAYDGEFGIFFEYGAESGVLQPPWDAVGPEGSGDKGGSYVQVDDTHVRTGSQCVKFYQVPPIKSDAQRRVELRYVSTLKEYYLSWWAYFPSGQGWESEDIDGWGTTLGGYQAFFGPPGDKWRWWTGGRFGISKSDRTILFAHGWGKSASADDFDISAEAEEQEWATGYHIRDYLDQWINFQVYVRWANNSQGIVRAWFNNNLVAERTGLNTDPSGYSRFTEEDCVWGYSQPYPFIVIEFYQSESSAERGYWVDDIIGATEKVPNNSGASS